MLGTVLWTCAATCTVWAPSETTATLHLPVYADGATRLAAFERVTRLCEELHRERAKANPEYARASWYVAIDGDLARPTDKRVCVRDGN
jgi:hypothetical protein